MRVLVCGGRNFMGKAYLYNILTEHVNEITAIVHGGAKGADSLAGQWAVEYDKVVEVYKADWEQYGKGAGYRRNITMAETRPDLVVAFAGGAGTNNMVEIAMRYGIPVADYR